jgi:hypothetical protein
MPVCEFRNSVYDATGNCMFHGILNSSTEAGDSRIDRGGTTHRISLKLREYYKAMHNPQTRIYGTNKYNFEYTWQRTEKY